MFPLKGHYLSVCSDFPKGFPPALWLGFERGGEMLFILMFSKLIAVEMQALVLRALGLWEYIYCENGSALKM